MSASLILNISRNCRLSILITKRREYTRCLPYIDYGRACNWVAPEEEELKHGKEVASLASTTHYSHQYKSQNVFLFAHNTTQTIVFCSPPKGWSRRSSRFPEVIVISLWNRLHVLRCSNQSIHNSLPAPTPRHTYKYCTAPILICGLI